MARQPRLPPPESIEDRWVREAQTSRNLEALELERDGRVEEAIALYERNAAEGFGGEWPYGRLVAIYERRGNLEEAERILSRAVTVFQTSAARTPKDRRAMVQTFKKRLALVQKARRVRARGAARRRGDAAASEASAPAAE